MNLAHARLLADHIEALHQNKGGYFADRIAEAIIADPQSHVDALVAAGVLEGISPRGHLTSSGVRAYWYWVVLPKPHFHEWQYAGTRESPSGSFFLAGWSCRSCSETATTDIEPLA
jgi:hypothetical protein